MMKSFREITLIFSLFEQFHINDSIWSSLTFSEQPPCHPIVKMWVITTRSFCSPPVATCLLFQVLGHILFSPFPESPCIHTHVPFLHYCSSLLTGFLHLVSPCKIALSKSQFSNMTVLPESHQNSLPTMFLVQKLLSLLFEDFRSGRADVHLHHASVKASSPLCSTQIIHLERDFSLQLRRTGGTGPERPLGGCRGILCSTCYFPAFNNWVYLLKCPA